MTIGADFARNLLRRSAAFTLISLCALFSNQSDAGAQSRPPQPPPYMPPNYAPIPQPMPPPQPPPFNPYANPWGAPQISPTPSTTIPEWKGLKDYYAQVSGEYLANSSQRNDPGGGKPAGNSRNSLMLQGTIGWGPVHYQNLLFYSHYRYIQDWGSTEGQMTQFLAKWFDKPTAGDFLFPTKYMFRTHEFNGDLRYVNPWFHLGLFGRYSRTFQGSSLMGERDEHAETVTTYENFVPYIAFKYQQYYRAQLAMPFRSLVNREDPRESTASYSFQNKARGRLFSIMLQQALAYPEFRSSLYVDLYYIRNKYYTITKDFDRQGISGKLDIPIWWNLRGSANASWHRDTYFVEKVRIPSFPAPDGVYQTEENQNQPAMLIHRYDSTTSYGFEGYFDINRQHRISASYSYAEALSTANEYNSKRQIFSAGYSWSLDSTNVVKRRIQQFTENDYANDF